MSSNFNVCIIINTPPSLDLEASELALALAAFDLPVQLILQGAGVLWLSPSQALKPNGKSASKVLSAFPIYGVDEIFYTAADIEQYGISSNSVPNFAKPISDTALASIVSQAKHCFTF